MEFSKSNITDEWWDLINEFPEFILELSPSVVGWYESYKDSDYVPAKEDLINLRYGFECGAGWIPTIREYFTSVRELVTLAKNNGHDLHYKTFIFKEKFGEIADQGDFYGEDRLLYWEQYIKLGNTLIIQSRNRCEICGNIGSIGRRGKSGWIRTLCDNHFNESGYK